MSSRLPCEERLFLQPSRFSHGVLFTSTINSKHNKSQQSQHLLTCFDQINNYWSFDRDWNWICYQFCYLLIIICRHCSERTWLPTDIAHYTKHWKSNHGIRPKPKSKPKPENYGGCSRTSPSTDGCRPSRHSQSNVSPIVSLLFRLRTTVLTIVFHRILYKK